MPAISVSMHFFHCCHEINPLSKATVCRYAPTGQIRPVRSERSDRRCSLVFMATSPPVTDERRLALRRQTLDLLVCVLSTGVFVLKTEF